MLAARLSRVPLTCFVTSFGKPQSVRPIIQNYTRQYATKPSRFTRRMEAKTKDQPTFKERMYAPAGYGAFTVGQGALAFASSLGLGALCYYGLGLSHEPGTLEYTRIWPEYVRTRVRDTYMYFAGGIGVTAATAVALSKNARLMNMMTRNSLLAIGATFAVMIGTSVVAQSIPYQKGFGAKQLAWMVHAGVLGAVVAPITVLGGPVLLRAAWMTAGVVGGLSTLAMCAPSEKFLNMGGPLACGLGVVLASSIAGAFIPPTTVAGASLYSISMYGGLILFSLFLLYDTQKIMQKAQHYPVSDAVRPFDPVNASLGIYADTLNIFIRLAMLMGGGNRRK